MREITKSSVLALAISIPISLLGALLSMGLAHSSGLVFFITKILYAPLFALSIFLDSLGIENMNNTAYIFLALISQFLGYFVVIILIRVIYKYAKLK